MKGMTIVFALLAAAGTLGCSHLHVRTEVFTATDTLGKDGTPQRVAEIATIANQSLMGYEDRIKGVVVNDYRQLIQTLRTQYPDTFQDSTDAYVKDFSVTIDEVLAPVRVSANAARQLAVQLGADGPGSKFKHVDNLLAGLSQLKLLVDATTSQAQAALDGIAATEVAQYRDALRLNYLHSTTQTVKLSGGRTVQRKVYPNDADLARRVNTKIDDSTREAATEKLVQDLKNLSVHEDAVLREELVAVANAVSSSVPDTAIIPLYDENIPLIISAPAEHWKPAVNDVVSTNLFGNAEIAFRMDGLGDSHIKGVLFDPSEAIKAGLDVFSKALQVTAAAYTGGAASGATDTTNTATTLSKPAIDAEIADASAAAAARSERLQSLFWNYIAIARSTPADEDAEAPAAAKELIALTKCATADLISGEVRKCGGQS